MTQVAAHYPAATMRDFASAPQDLAEHGTNIVYTAAVAPTSQSCLPGQSTTCTPLPSSSSNLSTSTAADTDFTSPSSTNAAMPGSSRRPQSADSQPPASRIDPAAANATRTGDTAPSPMSLGSPVSQGFKRTADGSVKGAGLGIERAAPAAHKRNKSMDTHAGTRIGELSAQLKTRLSYAMVKVQNGWEKQSLEELEEVHSQRGSPSSAPGRSDRVAFNSPYAGERRRRPSGVSDNSDAMVMSPASDPARSHAATPASYWRAGNRPAMNAAANLISITGAQPGSGLAPAPDFDMGRRRRSSVSYAPPSLLGTSQRKHYSDLGAGTRPPTTPLAGILRMPSQQAEKDAVDTLLFMSSPNNSQRFPNTGPPVLSPLRADAPQRRVMFEAYPPQEKRVVYQPPMPAPPHHQYGAYPTYPAR